MVITLWLGRAGAQVSSWQTDKLSTRGSDKSLSYIGQFYIIPLILWLTLPSVWMLACDLMAKVVTLNKPKKSRILQLLFHSLIGPHQCKLSLSNNHIHMSEYLTQQLVSIISHSGSLSPLMMTWLFMFPSHWAWYCLVDWRVPGLFQYLMKYLIGKSHEFTSKNYSLNYLMALKFDTCLISQWSDHINSLRPSDAYMRQ